METFKIPWFKNHINVFICQLRNCNEDRRMVHFNFSTLLSHKWMKIISLSLNPNSDPSYVTQYNKRYILSPFDKFRFLLALTGDLTAFQWYQICKKLKWYFWKYKFYKVCISFYFLYMWPNTTKGTWCLLLRKLRSVHYLTDELTSFPMIPNS